MARPRRLSAIRTDWGLLLIVLALMVVGLVMVYSASYGFALISGGQFEGQPTYFVQRQAMFAVVGLIAMLVAWRIDYHIYQRFAVHILVGTLALLAIMAIIQGRWLFGGGSSVQPSELAKIGAIIYIAVWLAAKGDEIRDVRMGLVPFALLVGAIAGLIVAQPNYSTAILLVATATAMFFVAGADIRQLLISFVFGGAGLIGVAFLMSYRSDRIQLWLNSPFSDVLGEGFQTVQSLVALDKGGWLGVGLGQSQQKFTLYAPHTDAIFAILGEELGLVGAVLVIGLYGLWVWRGLRVARRAPDTYGMLLAIGIVAWVGFQAILHIAVVTATSPFTGTLLPFVSYGGSSLMSLLFALGILLNISRQAVRTESGGSP
jgi:cell division protein FtsW